MIDMGQIMYDKFLQAYITSPTKAKATYNGYYANEGAALRTRFTQNGAKYVAEQIIQEIYNNDLLENLNKHIVME